MVPTGTTLRTPGSSQFLSCRLKNIQAGCWHLLPRLWPAFVTLSPSLSDPEDVDCSPPLHHVSLTYLFFLNTNQRFLLPYLVEKGVLLQRRENQPPIVYVLWTSTLHTSWNLAPSQCQFCKAFSLTLSVSRIHPTSLITCAFSPAPSVLTKSQNYFGHGQMGEGNTRSGGTCFVLHTTLKFLLGQDVSLAWMSGFSQLHSVWDLISFDVCGLDSSIAVKFWGTL